jgi:glutamate dehydrogenase (NAD(P)+)
MNRDALSIHEFPPVGIHPVEARGLRGWLVVDSLRDGLAFGGFRFSPSVSEEEVRDLARAMTWKLAAHGLPVGGAKAGLRCRPDDPELPAALIEVAAAWRRPLRECAVLGKDMGASDALLDQLYAALGTPQLALAKRRGGPERIRDLGGYVRHMTGRGAAWAAEAAVGTLAGKRVAIQGAGLVGVGTAVRVCELGGRVVGISDVSGAIAAPDGLPVDGLLAATSPDTRQIEYGAISFPCERIERERLLAVDADILVLAAGSRLVTGEQARTIAAQLVVEASNLGLTEAAHDELHAAGVTVVPDVIASSSSAALVAHQLASRDGWEPERLWGTIATAIREAVKTSAALAKARGGSLRGAYFELYRQAIQSSG